MTKLLKIDGLFLIVMGTLAAVMDVLGYYTGNGPFGPTYFQKSITIGGFEAHCLAAILGFILFSKRNSTDSFFFNKIAIAIHGILMFSNLIWFDVFIETNTLPMGYIATAIHFILILFNIVAIYRGQRHIR